MERRLRRQRRQRTTRMNRLGGDAAFNREGLLQCEDERLWHHDAGDDDLLDALSMEASGRAEEQHGERRAIVMVPFKISCLSERGCTSAWV